MIFIHIVFKLDHTGKTTEETQKLYERLNEIIYNDDVDELIDLVNRNESIVTKPYHINKSNFRLTLFEFSILVKSMKCFKYLLLNNAIDSYHYIESTIMRSNNVEAYRAILNTKSELICIPELAIHAIRFHRNEFFEHLFHSYDLMESISKFVKEALTEYNYNILAFLFENNALNGISLPIYTNCEKYIVVILYLLEEYNISIPYNWDDVVESFIASPLSVDRVIEIMRKVYIDIKFGHNTYKEYLLKCFQMRKPKEYIDKMVEFIYGHKQLTFSEVSDVNPFKLLDTLYKFHHDINIITFIETMFTPDYVYTKKELRKITTLINTYPEYNKVLTLLL